MLALLSSEGEYGLEPLCLLPFEGPGSQRAFAFWCAENVSQHCGWEFKSSALTQVYLKVRGKRARLAPWWREARKAEAALPLAAGDDFSRRVLAIRAWALRTVKWACGPSATSSFLCAAWCSAHCISALETTPALADAAWVEERDKQRACLAQLLEEAGVGLGAARQAIREAKR